MLSEKTKQRKDNMPLQNLATVEVTPHSHLGFTCTLHTNTHSHTPSSLC